MTDMTEELDEKAFYLSCLVTTLTTLEREMQSMSMSLQVHASAYLQHRASILNYDLGVERGVVTLIMLELRISTLLGGKVMSLPWLARVGWRYLSPRRATELASHLRYYQRVLLELQDAGWLHRERIPGLGDLHD